ncbi:hypothetical protein OIN60_11050 [Paenibacillus sp. P96]|uniref:Uncharacterized protein n=1 Tax=Paenibacillus zeirhizosphaerae TaxID=2987519 RepID=A0ABT9FRE4_9BACL|nr:hypothetical protein [Paenibacillus sp. P96]MDP4097308.1 hypothetical protein [Paenibacillus sp. P96]
MQMIYPLEKDVCRQHIGRNVCVVLHDGSYMTGTLSEVTENGLVFGGAPVAPMKSSVSKGKQRRKKTPAVKIKAFDYGYPYQGYYSPYRNFAPWAAIAFLFLLPFLFI